MFSAYTVYFAYSDTLNVEFSQVYNSFNSAKSSMEAFLEEQLSKIGKKGTYVTKEEFEVVKNKPVKDSFYIRKKNSEATVFAAITNVGRFYDTYSISKFGKVGITEFNCFVKGASKEVVVEKEKTKEEEKKAEPILELENKTVSEIELKELHVTNYERGAHVSFINDLKSRLKARQGKEFVFEKIKNTEEDGMKVFIGKLQEGKSRLKSLLVDEIRQEVEEVKQEVEEVSNV